MATITPAKSQGLVATKEARNFYPTAYSGGLPVQFSVQASRGELIDSMARAINFLAGRMPKICFSQSADPDALEIDGSDPLYRFAHLDNAKNAKTRRHTVLSLPRESGTNDSYAIQYGGTDQTQTYGPAVGTPTFPGDSFLDRFDVDVSADADEVKTDGLTTVEGYTVLDYLVEDLPNDTLDSATDTSIIVPLAATGQEILEDAEKIRAALHALRQVNHPMVIRWSAAIPTGGYATPGSSDATAIVCPTASYASFANILDSTVTTRTGSSPGITAHRYRCGRGDESTTAGRKVKVICRVLANSAAADANIKFIGPTGIASNDTTITVTGGGGVAFYGDDTNILYLDSSIDDPTDATRNKIDIYCQVASGTCYIYGLYAWEVYL